MPVPIPDPRSPGPGALPAPLVVELLADSVLPHGRIRVSGELDAATAGELGARMETITGAGYRRLDLDVRDVSFCDLAGLDALLAARAVATDLDGAVRLSGARRSLALLLAVLGLSDTLEPVGLECPDVKASRSSGSPPTAPAPSS